MKNVHTTPLSSVRTPNTILSVSSRCQCHESYDLLRVNSWPYYQTHSKSAKTMISLLLHLFLLVSVAAGDGNPLPVRREVHGGGRIFDISHRYVPEMPSWGASEHGLGQFLWLRASMKKGSKANGMEVKMPTHTGTHVDAPGHMIDRYFDAGFDVDTLDLEVLNGPAILVDVPRDKNITAEVIESLKIPKGVRRVIFRTSNTDRQLMFKREYDTSYTAFTVDGAKWLVENTDIKLVGVDFLSVATHEHLVPAHLEFLESREIILVEGLKLDSVAPGLYSVHCLPLRLLGAEGSPIRCILIK